MGETTRSNPGLEEWLNHVDNELIPQAVEHLKLGLYSELAPHYDEAKDIQEPSVLFEFLLKKCLKNNQPKCLKIFLHVLRSLSGSFKGRQLVGEAFSVTSRYRIEDPGVLDVSKTSVNFKFFQCLLKIALHARKVALGEQLLKRFCKERFLNRNYSELKGVPELFIILHQSQIIAADFTHHLVEALSKYKAWICVQQVNDYHKSVGLRSVTFSDAYPGVFSSSVEDSIYSRDLPVEYSSLDRRRRSSKNLDLITVFDDIPPSNGSINGGGESSLPRRTTKPNEPPNYDVIEASDADHLLTNRYGIQRSYSSVKSSSGKKTSGRNLKKGDVFLMLGVILLIFFLVSMLVVLGATVWQKVSSPPPQAIVPIRQGTTVILGDYNTFYYQQVHVDIFEDHFPNVSENTDYYIDLYGISGSCSNLDSRNVWTKKFSVMFNEKNITNFIPTYAATGSTFDFDLNGQVPLDSTEKDLVEVCVYIGAVYGRGRKLECNRVSMTDSSGHWDVEEPGYYYFTVQAVTGSAKFSFNIIGNVKHLHVRVGELLDCNLTNNISSCSLELPFTAQAYCLMAEFYKLPYNYLKTELEVGVTGRRVGVVMSVTLVPLVFLVVLVFLIILLIRLFCMKCIRKIRNADALHPMTYSI